MKDLTEVFTEWMDRKGLRPDELADRFGVERQTIANWRSAGVPKRRTAHVLSVMASWPDAPGPSGPNIQPLLLQATIDQFDRWNRAALSEGKIVREWIIESLDKMSKMPDAHRHAG